MKKSPPTHFLSFAHALADAAGAAIRPYFGAHGNVEAKDDNSPVTKADRAAEAAMRTLITQHYPDHGIYGEEFGQNVVSPQSFVVSPPHDSRLTTHDYTWMLDPIDGTRAFIAGRKEWGTLIALCEDGVPILGILDQPITGERWVGMREEQTTCCVIASDQRECGNPSFLTTSLSTQTADGLLRRGAPRNDGVAIRTRPCASLAATSISTTSRRYFTPEQAMAFVKLAEQCREVVEDGDCYAYGLLARGERDIVVDAGLKPYDILALVPIVEGAGGKITTWDGAAVTLENYRNVVAVGDKIQHAPTLRLLSGN